MAIGRQLRSASGAIAGLVAVLLLLEALAALALRSPLVLSIVDIQRPSVLCAKLAALARFDGMKVVLLGDSLVYGRTMAAHGDKNWRQHQLAAILEKRLRAAEPGRRILVLNLGMNGSLPADQEQVVRLLAAARPDVIVLDVALRSFSADFAKEGERLSRPWLQDLVADAGGCRLQPASGRLDPESAVAAGLLRFSSLFAVRDLLRWRWFDGNPRDAAARLRDAVSATVSADVDEPEMLLMLNAKRRHETIFVDRAHPQLAALDRMLAAMQRIAGRSIAFYAQEDPQRLPELMDGSSYARMRARLSQHLAGTAAHVSFIEAFPELEPHRYLDYVHVDARGYEIIADRLVQAIGAR